MATNKHDVSAAASKAKRIQSDGQAVERHGLKDQLDADDRISSTDAVKKPGRGLLFSRTKPPGTT